MKKLLSVLIALMMMVTFVFAEEAAPAEVKTLYAGVLTVGCEAGYPPFEMVADDGESVVGLDMDIMAAVAEKLGLQMQVVTTSFDGIFDGIGVNYDVVCSAVTITPDRMQNMLFSLPYITNYQAVVVPADKDVEINSFMDLDGYVIGVQKGTTADILMGDYESTQTINVTVVANDKLSNCFTQLTNGEIQAVVVDSGVAESYVAKNPELYKIVYQDMTEGEQFAIAMGLNDTDMQAAIGCEQLKKFPSFIERRRHNWDRLRAALEPAADKLILPEPAANSRPSWFGFLISIKPESGLDRNAVTRYIEDHNVQTRLLFSGNLIKHPCFDQIRGTDAYRVAGELTNTDFIMNNTFWVGVYPGMTDEMIDYMAQVILEAVKE